MSNLQRTCMAVSTVLLPGQCDPLYRETAENLTAREKVEAYSKTKQGGYIVLAALLGLTICLMIGCLLLGSTLGAKTAGKWFGLVFF